MAPCDPVTARGETIPADKYNIVVICLSIASTATVCFLICFCIYFFRFRHQKRNIKGLNAKNNQFKAYISESDERCSSLNSQLQHSLRIQKAYEAQFGRQPANKIQKEPREKTSRDRESWPLRSSPSPPIHSHEKKTPVSGTPSDDITQPFQRQEDIYVVGDDSESDTTQPTDDARTDTAVAHEFRTVNVARGKKPPRHLGGLRGTANDSDGEQNGQTDVQLTSSTDKDVSGHGGGASSA